MGRQMTDREIAAAAVRWHEARSRRLALAKQRQPISALAGVAALRKQIDVEEQFKEARRLELRFLRLLAKACDARRAQIGDVEDARTIEAVRAIE